MSSRPASTMNQVTTHPRSTSLATPAITRPTFVATAFYVGDQINLRELFNSNRTPAQQPATVRLGDDGLAIIYRYGAVVFFNVSKKHQRDFLTSIEPHIRSPYNHPEYEEERIITCEHDNLEGEIASSIYLQCATKGRLEVIASVLSKSVVLAQYESDISANFELIEPFAAQLERAGSCATNARELLQHIGRTLLNEVKMLARVEVTDRPSLLWEHPELEQLYIHLEEDFELKERAGMLDTKLELISRTVGTMLEIVQRRRSTRVEWYVVILILLEIAIMVYQMWMQHG